VEGFQNIDIEVPEGLNPELVALGWLVGVWEGSGNGTDHEGNDFTFEQRIEFTHNGGAYLFYVSQVFGMGEDGKFDQPLGMETGFWRPKRDASVEVTLTNSDGWTEVLVGRIQVTQISLLTDAVVRTESADAGIAEAIDDLLGEARLVVVPTGLPEAYKRAAARSGRELVEDSPEQPIATLDLDRVDAVVTCSRVGISISGTIVLDGEPDQGRRAITLVPDRHVCVLERESIVPTVPQAVDVLGEHPARPMTWIAGPSATADIELVRVQGVHGPRNLGVVIAH